MKEKAPIILSNIQSRKAAPLGGASVEIVTTADVDVSKSTGHKDTDNTIEMTPPTDSSTVPSKLIIHLEGVMMNQCDLSASENETDLTVVETMTKKAPKPKGTKTSKRGCPSLIHDSIFPLF